MSRSCRLRGEIAGWLLAWVLAIGAGMLLMHAYAAYPGDPGEPSTRWPVGTRLGHDGDRSTLLIFLHPKCPCSRASVTELAAILAQADGRVAAQAVLFRPLGVRDPWFPSDLLAELAEIADLEIAPDPGGEEARRFGVATSGHVLLYDTRGDLAFSGGITPGRGERPDAAGRSAMLARLLAGAGRCPDGPVFGCPLATCRPTGRLGQPR